MQRYFLFRLHDDGSDVWGAIGTMNTYVGSYETLEAAKTAVGTCVTSKFFGPWEIVGLTDDFQLQLVCFERVGVYDVDACTIIRDDQLIWVEPETLV